MEHRVSTFTSLGKLGYGNKTYYWCDKSNSFHVSRQFVIFKTKNISLFHCHSVLENTHAKNNNFDKAPTGEEIFYTL